MSADASPSLHIMLSDEERMLADAAARYMERAYSFAERSRLLESGPSFDRKHWTEFAHMGWLALPLPEQYGGAEGDARTLYVLAREFGRALVVEPYLSTAVLGAGLIARAGSERQRRSLLGPLAEGQMLLALACAEPREGYDWFDLSTRAARAGDHFVLNGDKSVVLGSAHADWLIVSARTSEIGAGGQRCDRNGVSLFLVERNQRGVAMRPYTTIDGRHAAEVQLNQVRVPSDALLGSLDGAAPHLDHAWNLGTLWLLGEAVGCLEGMVSATVTYLNQREQFGQKLSKFQALRHRVADMQVGLRETQALCEYAAQAFALGSDTAAAALAAAKSWVGRTGMKMAEEGVQLHGAIAITDEYIAGHYMKRLTAIDRMFGDGDAALDRYLKFRGRFDDVLGLSR
jgi:alkylation response protein AidB-like acyl-CoA dehydrogenase